MRELLTFGCWIILAYMVGGYLTDTVTTYAVKEYKICDDNNKDCYSREGPASRSNFYINKENQFVIEKIQNTNAIIKYTDCKIFNKENWICLSEDKSLKMEMHEGDFNGTFDFDSSYRFVSVWEYWFLKLSSYF